MKNILVVLFLVALSFAVLPSAQVEAYNPGVTINIDVDTTPERLFSASDTSIDGCRSAIIRARPANLGAATTNGTTTCWVGPNANPALVGGYALNGTEPSVTLPEIKVPTRTGFQPYDLGDWYGDCEAANNQITAICFE